MKLRWLATPGREAILQAHEQGEWTDVKVESIPSDFRNCCRSLSLEEYIINFLNLLSRDGMEGCVREIWLDKKHYKLLSDACSGTDKSGPLYFMGCGSRVRIRNSEAYK